MMSKITTSVLNRVLESSQVIAAALIEAAHAVEDIDDPVHYTRQDLRNITAKATKYRLLARDFEWLDKRHNGT